MYHRRVHGPDHPSASARLARSLGDRRARSATHRDPRALARRRGSSRARGALGDGRRLRGGAAAPTARSVRPPRPPHRRLPLGRRWIARLGALSPRRRTMDRRRPRGGAPVGQLDGAEPWQPVEMLTVFRALDWARLDHIPPLAEPRRLPGGAGSAVLNLLAALMKDQGLPRTRYRGPFPTEQLFTSLLESFRHDPTQALPLERFLADGGLDWLPAPYESHQVAPWVTVQLRQGIEKVVADGVTFYRTEWQGIKRREPRVIREDGERVVCSLWALGGPLEDRLILDRSGEVVEAPPPQAR